jgi:hypothetical protein
MMVATEAMPVDATLSPKAAAPAQIKSSKLANGIRIVSRDGGAGSVSMSFAVMCGSSAESLSEQGSAKLLSMAAFGGSADKSGLRICRDLENAGASFCASSDRQKITYSVSCLADNAEEVFGVVANAIAHPIEANRHYVLDEDAKEKATVIATARGADARAQVSDLLMEAAYGENTAFGKPEHAPTVKNMSAEAVLAFRAAHFTSGNLVVSASGLPHDALKYVVCSSILLSSPLFFSLLFSSLLFLSTNQSHNHSLSLTLLTLYNLPTCLPSTSLSLVFSLAGLSQSATSTACPRGAPSSSAQEQQLPIPEET